MNKCLVALLLVLFPLLAMAAGASDSSSLSLAPPTSDYSVAFLGNLFGIVDGVLHGTGSQIMGAMFSVFNSAVLALGGIVIMYTLLVGTMNTAHEGEMLGHKWSSIWIPVRSTAGLALLIPKASGYCLMQIFVMWVVVQGVGAADKVWGAALDYLNRGGVIIQASRQQSTSISQNTDQKKIAEGAAGMLASQVCMLGLQKQLETARKSYLAMVDTTSPGPCGPANVETNGMKGFCSTPVPDLLATVDAVAYQTAQTSSGDTPPASFSMPVPFFPSTAGGVSSNPYAFLQGICGKITWNAVKIDSVRHYMQAHTADVQVAHRVPTYKKIMGMKFRSGSTTTYTTESRTTYSKERETTDYLASMGQADADTGYQPPESQMDEAELIGLTRAAAVQQMYMSYQPVAEAMVNNDPQIVKPTNINTTGTTPAWPWATNVFGVPYSSSAAMPCAQGKTDCFLWQGGFAQPSASSSSVAGIPIFNGAEFQNGMADYNGVMMPTINLMAQMQDANAAKASRLFIAEAKTQGWLTAGSYFFNLVSLSGSATANSDKTDTNTGLGGEDTNVAATKLVEAFGSDSSCTGDYATLCTWLSAAPLTPSGVDRMKNIADLIGTQNVSLSGDAITGAPASTVKGFVINSLTISLPGQPGMKGPDIDQSLFPALTPAGSPLDKVDFGCMRVPYVKCLVGKMLDGIFEIVRKLSDLFVNVLAKWINTFLVEIIKVPIAMLQGVFINQVNLLVEHPGDNPIVQLAQMGINYINAPANLYVGFIMMELSVSKIPLFGGFIAGILMLIFALASPLIVGWMGVMMAVGFTTAYYVPFLPYMVFTFGVIAWLMAVVEAMVAAPIVALGITHPEGEGIMGSKGEHALLILMNVFLRPALMIIGYITAIALCYISVWIINTGFANVLKFIQPGGYQSFGFQGSGYTSWAGLYVVFFSVVIYTSMYVTAAQKAFDLIFQLPDHVLRWIGGTAEQTGEKAAGWAGETKEQVGKAGEATKEGQKQTLEVASSQASKMKKPGGGAKLGAK